MPWLALHAYATTVCLDHLFDDGQTKAGTASCACARGIGAIETLEDIGQMLRRDATTGITHAHSNFILIPNSTNSNIASCWCMGDRIADQIAQDLAHALGICLDPQQMIRQIDMERDLLICRLQA